MSDRINKKKILLSIIILFIISFLVETFVFNIRFFQTVLYTEVPFSDANSLRIENGNLDAAGNIELDEGAEELVITVDDINLPLKNVMFDVEMVYEDPSVGKKDQVCDVSVSVWDDSLHEVIGEDGNTRIENGLYKSTSKRVIHSIPASRYIWLETYGNVKSIEFRISSASGMGRIFRIDNIIYNAYAPFEFSVFRFIFILIILTLLHLVYFVKEVWNADCVTPAKWKVAVPVVLLILIAVPSYVWPSLNPSVSRPVQDEYGPLARALLNGETSVGDVSELVRESEGKMVFWNSYSNDVKFDYSSYAGKYYVYFGVLPCIVFYVPYYLLTGRDLPNYIAFVTLCLILIAEIYLFLGMLIRRFYRRTPYMARLLMTGAACSGMYLPLFISVPDHYVIAICFGIVLLLAGCMNWLRVVFPARIYEEHTGEENDKKRTDIGFLAAGSVCMAAVSLCRPTLLIPGFVLMGLMLIRAMKAREKIIANSGREIAGCVSAIVLPYFLIGLICMFYNHVRFDSPFDFGVSKNMTVIPLNGNHGYLPFQFARSVYEYFFAPAAFTPEFPYFTYQTWKQIAEGSSILAVTKQDIGLFSGAPVLWGGLLCFLYRNKLKEKKIWSFMLAMLACAMLLMLFSTRFTSSITDRYTLEFSFIYFVWAFVGIMELYDNMREKSEIRLFHAMFVIVKSVFAITLLFGFLQLIPGKGMYNLSQSDPELYYRIYYAMNFML